MVSFVLELDHQEIPSYYFKRTMDPNSDLHGTLKDLFLDREQNSTRSLYYHVKQQPIRPLRPFSAKQTYNKHEQT